ncbi:MAG TPA: hypothetical protein VJ440_09685 [Candidatus Brocadiaceae bacterium]|nr:hypothetical protein [Candidatus Brocadiaceae bacterium]
MREKIVILKSEIKNDCNKLSSLFVKFEKAYKDFLDSGEYSKLVESAFYVSQLFSGFENIFKNVAKTFENNIEQDYWHKSLLDRMYLDIQDIRPALISEESYKGLDELRAFRHFFRHAYNIDLNKDKFRIVAEEVFVVKNLIFKEIDTFLAFLDLLFKKMKK